MKRLVLAAALAVGAVGCEPEINQDEAPDQVVVQFDPSAVPAVVPAPNDLAIDRTTGKVNAPIDPNSSPAQQEFTRDYLNSLNGFPVTAAGSASVSAALDPTSVTPASVLVIPINDVAKAALLPKADGGAPAVTPAILYDTNTNRITVTPNPAWPKGSQVGVAILGGANGVKSADGRPVVSSATWALLTSDQPLAKCPPGPNGQPDFTSADCTLGTNLIPSNITTNAQERFNDQLNSAKRLEQLRLSYAPALAALVAQGVAREDILLFWTWTTVAQPEPTFDPAGGIIPFPNNLLLSADGTRVNLPVPGPVTLPDGGTDTTQRDLFTGLNTLDGFSTTAAIVSENSLTLGTLADPGARLVAESVDGGTFFARLSGTAASETEPVVRACLNCSASAPPTATTPQQLQWVPEVPLDERTNYVAALTTDAQGTLRLADGTERTAPVMAPGAWALLRMENPIADLNNNKSLVSGVPDANATALERIRARLKPLVDEAVAAGIPRSKMALATVFRTQSNVSSLTAIAQGLTAALPTRPLYVFNTGEAGLAAFGSLPRNNVAALYQGKFPIANLLTGTSGTFNPNPAEARGELVEFNLTVPSTEMPADGYPVVIFGHGLTRYRNDLLAIANTLAGQGFAAISTDVVYHGERTTCVGARAALGQASDDAACADPATQRCETDPESASFGRCVARSGTPLACSPVPVATQPVPGDTYCSRGGVLVGPPGPNLGRCVPTAADFSTGVCEGGSFRPTSSTDPRPVISGWNILNTANLFATRDNFRQQAIDLTQLVRVIKGNEMAAALGDVRLNTAQIHYAGQSLGGILGTLFTAVNGDVRNVALNVPGTDLATILLTSPSFEAQRNGFLARLAAGGLTPGTPGFDQFIGIAKWITDPADPQNYAFTATNRTTSRNLFIQYIEDDQTIPNPTTEQLIRACNRPGSKDAATFKWTGEGLAVGSRHGFLLNFTDAATTVGAQTQLSSFLQAGELQP